MKRIVRLSESDLVKIVKRVINEQETNDGLEKLKSQIVNKTANLYTGQNEKQNEYKSQIKIQDVTIVSPDQVKLVDTNGMGYVFSCTESQGGLVFGSQKIRLFNKQITSLINSEYCQKKRDVKGNLKTVPPADFASTGGGTSGMA